MILFLGENRKIVAYKETAEDTKIENAGKVFYDGEFDFFMGEDRAGYEKVFYLDENGTIRVEYEKLPPDTPPLSEQEQIAIDTALNVEYIACLMEANLQQL